MKTALLQEIYELILSLTKSEKRYFKLYTQFQSGNKSYLKLFSIIERQKTYDEEEITKSFLRFNRVGNLPAVKKYLFDQLIASLKSYGAYKDLDSDHTDMIETYKVLHYKGLQGQSERLLKKIKQITWQDDAFTRYFSVLLMEYLKEAYSSEDVASAKIQGIIEERRHTLAVIQNYMWVGELLTMQRIHLRKKLYCRNKKEKDELGQLMAPLLRSKETDMLSRTALGLRNMARCDYYMAIGDPVKAFKTSKIYLELRKNAGSTDKVDTQTISEYAQHLVLSVRSGIFDGFEEDSAGYKSFIDGIRNKEKYYMGYERWLTCVFIFYNRTGQFEKAEVFLDIEKKRTPFDKYIGAKSKMTLWYFMAYNQYARQQYKKSLRYIQQLMCEADGDVEELVFARLLLMFIHYDLKNYELLDYQARSAQRLMVKKERLYQSERKILNFFNTIKGGESKKALQQKITGLSQQINALFKTPYEKGFSFYFDIQSWLESQLTGMSFAATVKKYYGFKP